MPSDDLKTARVMVGLEMLEVSESLEVIEGAMGARWLLTAANWYLLTRAEQGECEALYDALGLDEPSQRELDAREAQAYDAQRGGGL